MQKINEKAMLVNLSIGMPGNSKKDVKLTQDTIRTNHLGDDAGRWLKYIFPPEALDPLETLSTKCRTYHYANSLPWSDEGWRILPSAHYEEYTKNMRQWKDKYLDKARNHFMSRLNEWESWARQKHNGTFNPADYIATKLERKFYFDLTFNPVPNSGDFRVQLTDDDLDIIKSATDARVDQAVHDAHKQLWTRLLDPVKHLADKLSDPKAKFHDSITSNIQEIVQLAPKLDLLNDQALQQAIQQIKDQLANLKPDTLRTDTATRTQAASQARAILDRLSGYQL